MKPHPVRPHLVAQARTQSFGDPEIDQGVVLARLTKTDGTADPEFGIPPNGATYLWVGKCGAKLMFTLASTDGNYYLHNVVDRHYHPAPGPSTPEKDWVQWQGVQNQGIFGGATSTALSDSLAADSVAALVQATLATYSTCVQCGTSWCRP